jgi:Tol biopolymer transport system component
MRRLALCTIGALVLGLAGGTAARADVFESISLASVNQFEQAGVAEHPAISGNGRFVAFDGSFGGVSGVWRADLSVRPRAIAPVAVGAVGTPESDAKLPSISEDGRYVSFTTTARLDEGNDSNGGPDVYVRDMSNSNSKPCPPEASEPCAFTLASAVDGSAKGLTYSYGAKVEETTTGSLASGRSALSADGRHVAFVTTAASDLAGPETPTLQVAVRGLDTKRTRLVSALYDPSTGAPKLNPETGRELPVPVTQEGGTIGAVFHEGRSVPTFPFPGASVGASISADGSTVAWLGQKIEAQAPLLAEDQNRVPSHAEPLWRRLAPLGPTRRVSGGSDPLNPACAATGEPRLQEPLTLQDPCAGPFGLVGNITGIEPAAGNDYLPRLSGDGRIVAFLADATLVAGSEFGSTGNFSDDLYTVDMADGLTRVQALRRLTAVAAGSATDIGRVEPVEDLSVSPDGSQVAFTSRRTVFPLGSPSYVSPPLAAPTEESGPQELYDVDFTNDTLTRVTHGFDGGPTESPARGGVSSLSGSPSFSADGNRLAFSSNASNLVYGDGNGASDVFVVDRKHFGATAVQQYISPPPANPTGEADWLLGVIARSRRDGSVVLEVFVPGPGRVQAAAESAVLVSSVRGARAGRHGRGASRQRAARSVAIRTVATAARASGREGLVVVPLVLAPRYRSLSLAPGGQSAMVSLAFSAPGHPLLQRRIAVTFRDPLPRRGHAAHHKSRSHARSGFSGGRRR